MVKKLILAFICIISICSISNAKEVFVLDAGKSKIYIEDTNIHTALYGKSIYSIENAYISNIVYHLYYNSNSR